MASEQTIAVIIPCYNEAGTIQNVVSAFARVLPEAIIYVYDNASSDETAAIASVAGAQVRQVSRRGKGNVVKAMFRDINADLYVMADGDDTYPADSARQMIEQALLHEADMVVGNRMPSYQNSQSRSGHFGANRLITKAVNLLFDSDLKDVLSGYRVLSRRFVKSAPLFSQGFEVETTLAIHALEVDAKIIEIPIEYSAREAGTTSKLNSYSDGLRITHTILSLFKDRHPKFIYGGVALLFFLSALILGIPVTMEYFETSLVPRFPSAILASALMILAMMSFVTGIIVKEKMTFMTTR